MQKGKVVVVKNPGQIACQTRETNSLVIMDGKTLPPEQEKKIMQMEEDLWG